MKNTRDEALVALLASLNGMTTTSERKRGATALLGLANRIESGSGDYPNLTQAAAELANEHGGDEHERAVHASKTILRPLRRKLQEGP